MEIERLQNMAENDKGNMNTPYEGLSDLELRILKLFNAGNADIDIAAEVQMDESAVAAIIDKLDGLGFTL